MSLTFHQGGLDCRYLTTHLVDRNFSVLSVTTIATPHRGSTFADYFLETIGQARLPQVLSLLDMLPNGGGDGKAFEFLTLENMKKFNEHTPDVEGVQYFSYGAEYEPGLIDTWKYGCPPYLYFFSVCGSTACQVSSFGSLGERGSERWIGVHYVCSLGSCSPLTLYSLSSHKTRQGTYLGTLEHVNHLDLVGWINTARYKWAELMGNEIKFKPATFYLGIVDHLAKVVEGLKLEDVDAERGDGHGEILDTVPHEATQREAQQAPTGEGGSTEFPSLQEPSGKGKDKDPGPATTLGNSHYKPIDVPLPAVVAVDISTPPSTRRSETLPHPDGDHENRGSGIPVPFPHARPYNDK